MVLTPWGDSGSLRGRRLSPGSRLPTAEVTRRQRERLFGATVAAIAERGYEGTRVEDLVALSGVSRSDFYEHFADKRACFMATLEEMIRLTVAFAAEQAQTPGSWEERAKIGFESFAWLCAAQPAAARVALLEAHAAGREVVERIDQATAGFEAVTAQVLRESPERAEMPDEMVRAYVGAVQEICRSRLRQGTESELPAVMDELWELMSGYRPPPRPLRKVRLRRSYPPEPIDGHDQAERALRAFVAVVAERGYGATTVAEVAQRGSMSTTTFYEHFADKRDALLAGIDRGGAETIAAALPAARRAPDWQQGVRAALGTAYSYLASRPALARLLIIEAYVLGPDALERRGEVLRPLAELLERGHELAPQTPGIAAEAILGGLGALAHRQVRDHGPVNLPALTPISTYIALAPFVGAEEACEAANSDGRLRRGHGSAR